MDHQTNTHHDRRDTYKELKRHFKAKHPDIPHHTVDYLHTLALPSDKSGKKRGLEIQSGGDAVLKHLTTNVTRSLSADRPIRVMARPNLRNHLYFQEEIPNTYCTDAKWTTPADPRVANSDSLAPGIPQDESYIRYNPRARSTSGQEDFIPVVYPTGADGTVLPAFESHNITDSNIPAGSGMSAGQHLAWLIPGNSSVEAYLQLITTGTGVSVAPVWEDQSGGAPFLGASVTVGPGGADMIFVVPVLARGLYGFALRFQSSAVINAFQASAFSGDGVFNVPAIGGVPTALGWQARSAGEGNDFQKVADIGGDYHMVGMDLRVTWESSTLSGGSLGIAILPTSSKFAISDDCNTVSLEQLAVQKQQWNNSARKGGYGFWLPNPKDFKYQPLRNSNSDNSQVIAAAIVNQSSGGLATAPVDAIRIETVCYYLMRTRSEIFSVEPQIDDPESVAAVLNYLENVDRCYENSLHISSIMKHLKGFGNFLREGYKVMRPMVTATLHEAANRLPISNETKEAIDQVERNFYKAAIAPNSAPRKLPALSRPPPTKK